MNFFQNIMDKVKLKYAEKKDRDEFLDMVETKAKPIRRAAYMNQIFKEVVNEGIEKAKQDSAKKVQKKKQPEDFGIGPGLEDPLKFMGPKKSKSKLRKQTK